MSVHSRVTHADELPYDNATSGLAADDVQAAIDEVAAAAGGTDVDGLLIADDDYEFLLLDVDPEQYLSADPEPA